MTTLKEIFESDLWIITEVMQGCPGQHRINAKRRFPVADKNSFFSKWGNTNYLNRLARENYGKPLHEFNTYKY